LYAKGRQRYHQTVTKFFYWHTFYILVSSDPRLYFGRLNELCDPRGFDSRSDKFSPRAVAGAFRVFNIYQLSNSVRTYGRRGFSPLKYGVRGRQYALWGVLVKEGGEPCPLSRQKYGTFTLVNQIVGDDYAKRCSI